MRCTGWGQRNLLLQLLLPPRLLLPWAGQVDGCMLQLPLAGAKFVPSRGRC